MNVSSNGFKAFHQGLIHHQRGNLAQAKEIYLSVLKGDPAHFDATHHLGLVHLAQGEIALAERLITRATELRPNDQDTTSNLLYLLNGQKNTHRPFVSMKFFANT